MTRRPDLFTAERQAERRGVLDNAIGAVWLAAIGGAITSDDAKIIIQILQVTAANRLREQLCGETQH